MSETIKVTLVEDHPEYRKSIEMILEREKDIQLIAQFGTADQALRSLQDLSTRSVPDLILLDLNLPGLTGIEAIPFFKQSIPDTKIIALTQSDQEADVLAAIQNGVDGYLLKASTRSQIADGIRQVIKGGASLDPKIAKFILRTLHKAPKDKNPPVPLSKREQEVLILLGEGLVKKEIAQKLKISTHTVINHVRSIYDKLNVPNAPAAINKAHRMGLFSPEK